MTLLGSSAVSANRVLLGDNLELMRDEPAESVQMAYLDPPFNTGSDRTRRTLATTADVNGDRTGFGGRRYATRLLEESSYRDAFDDYLGFLEPRLLEVRRLLHPTGTLYFHIDWREAHYCKLLLDELFGRPCFLNELIWAYDYGAKPRRRWPPKHDTILVYVKDPAAYFFDAEAVDREPYMAPGLVTSRPPGARRRATRRRSPRACCGASSRRRAVRATSASTRSPARARSGRWPPSWGGDSC
jgi:site-specific DNA-methyltransferase (adenine-specific)